MLEMDQLTGRADVHMHTKASDGLATVEQVLNYIEAWGGLDVIAITDHDVLDASLWAYAHRGHYSFDIIPGVEVTAREGHVVALWVTQPIPKKMSVKETAAAIHEQGGIAILAHPGEPFIAGRHMLRYLQHPEVFLEWGVDVVETYNAGSITPGNNLLARRLCRDLPLPVVGNSDAHTLNAIGYGITRFKGRTAADFRKALAEGRTVAEGASWPITDYLKLSPSSIRRKLNKFLGMSLRPIRQFR
ncbi:MAG: CehA/McbA family metallohydrolase, partial [Chloroflexota bacterium]